MMILKDRTRKRITIVVSVAVVVLLCAGLVASNLSTMATSAG